MQRHPAPRGGDLVAVLVPVQNICIGRLGASEQAIDHHHGLFYAHHNEMIRICPHYEQTLLVGTY